jgi:hypothetical protein
MTTKTAKRKLKDISFEKEGAHVALVSKDQGGPANNEEHALVMKSLNFSEEFVQKMQQVRVTMELPEFLRKFFGMYYSDAEVLAKMLGYQEPEKEDTEDYWEAEIQRQLDSFEILKSMYDGASMTEVLKSLSAEKYLTLLQNQEAVEKALLEIEKSKDSNKTVDENNSDTVVSNEGSTEAVAKAKESDENQTKVEPSESINKGKYMDELVEVQKALEAERVELAKARELIATFEAERKEAINKSRLAQLTTAVKDEARAAVLFKAVSLVESDEDFTAVVKALGDMQIAIEKSALFNEQGVQVEEVKPETESAVAKVIKSRIKSTK